MLKRWLRNLFKCKHKRLCYEFAGGKSCPYWESNNHCECDAHDCSVPVYDVICLECGQTWTIGEDEVMDFLLPLATPTKEEE